MGFFVSRRPASFLRRCACISLIRALCEVVIGLLKVKARRGADESYKSAVIFNKSVGTLM